MPDRGGFVGWILETWRRDQVPVWRAILSGAETTGQQKRAEYARWLLQEVLGAEQVEVEEKKP